MIKVASLKLWKAKWCQLLNYELQVMRWWIKP